MITLDQREYRFLMKHGYCYTFDPSATIRPEQVHFVQSDRPEDKSVFVRVVDVKESLYENNRIQLSLIVE